MKILHLLKVAVVSMEHVIVQVPVTLLEAAGSTVSTNFLCLYE